MTIDEFVVSNRCENVYHMSEHGSWPQIQALGLLSTSGLLDACGCTGPKRFEIESQLRKTKKQVTHPSLGTLSIRDQVPMQDWPEQGIYLDKLLDDGVSRQQWLEFLNKKVFFWVNKDDLQKMLCARQYSGKPQWVITVDTKALLRRNYASAYVSDQNTGSLYSRRKRGPKTFVPLGECPVRYGIKELAIDYHVPNLMDFVISVDEFVGRKVDEERTCRLQQHIWP